MNEEPILDHEFTGRGGPMLFGIRRALEVMGRELRTTLGLGGNDIYISIDVHGIPTEYLDDLCEHHDLEPIAGWEECSAHKLYIQDHILEKCETRVVSIGDTDDKLHVSLYEEDR